jgi:hypothetical protein
MEPPPATVLIKPAAKPTPIRAGIIYHSIVCLFFLRP